MGIGKSTKNTPDRLFDQVQYYLMVFTEPGMGLLAVFLFLMCLLPDSMITTILCFCGLYLFLLHSASTFRRITTHYKQHGLPTNELLGKVGYRFGTVPVYLSLGGLSLGLYLSLFFTNVAVFVEEIHFIPATTSSLLWKLTVISSVTTLMIILLGILLRQLNFATHASWRDRKEERN